MGYETINHAKKEEKMRKLLTLILATMILTSCSSGKSTIYPETGKVVSISGDAVMVETSTGNIFEFYGSEDWMIGDCVSLTMDSCGTDAVTDDIVIDAHYSAWKLN
jgi:hypothetical protein